MKITHRLSIQYFSDPRSGPGPAEWSTGLNSEENTQIEYTIFYSSSFRAWASSVEYRTE